MVSHKSVSTKRLVVESLSDIETSTLIELQSIANIPFSKSRVCGFKNYDKQEILEILQDL